MFARLRNYKNDRSRYQAAVLITDGLPYTDEYKENKVEALSVAKSTAENLLRDVRLLTYGTPLHKENGEKYLRQLVDNERENYFEFHNDASVLQEEHLSILFGKICKRLR